ncbi:MAG: RNA ligase RtcB family protein [Desulfobacteraceae bacterium]|jgi:release factor H-coupled RctB family protein
MSLNSNSQKNYRIICSENSWIEGDAVRQLQRASVLNGITYAVGLPDMHPGNCSPVGAAYMSKGVIYPVLIGNDVGCGVGLFSTQIKRKKIKRDKWIKKFKDLDQPFDGDLDKWRSAYCLDASLHDVALGTIGGGNHFAELQCIEKVLDHNTFGGLGLDKNCLFILVHSGSRSIGDALLRKHTDRFGAKGLDADSDEAKGYLAAHDEALKWAACNRALIAHRFGASINAKGVPVIDVCHNSVTRKSDGKETFWLHRKGATSSESELSIIPGSRGSLTYLVKARKDQEMNLWSLPHGAGRKWSRGSCKEKLRDRFQAKSLIKTSIGSYVICEDKNLLYEEAPQAYKNIDSVIADLIKADLIDVVAALKPIITYKTRKN